MFELLPDDHCGSIGLKKDLEDAKKTAEATSAFEGNVSQASKNNFFIDASSLLDDSEEKDAQNNKFSDTTKSQPPPFIRRKTFELEADDDKVATLRQEYERRQGNALFQTCSLEAPSSLPVGLSRWEGLASNDVHTPDSLNNDGFEEACDTRLECEEYHNENELVSPAPSPIGDYSLVHKDSVDVGAVLENELTDLEERLDNEFGSLPLASGGSIPDKAKSELGGLPVGRGVIDPDKAKSELGGLSLNSDAIVTKSELGGLPVGRCVIDPDKAKSELGGLSLNSDAIVTKSELGGLPLTSGAIVPDKAKSEFGGLHLASGGIIPDKAQSPMFSRRRTECAPILSGAAPPPEPISPEPVIEEKPRNLSASSAWVVDISDIVSSPETKRKKESRSLSSSLGYFIDLKGSVSPAMQRSAGNSVAKNGNCASTRDAERKNIFSSSGKGSIESCVKKAASQEISLGLKPSVPKVVHSPEQKIFTMFIGLNKEEPSDEKKEREPPSRRKIEDPPISSRKQGVYMYIGSDSPRESSSTSWKTSDRETVKKEHGRAKSLSTSDTAVIPDNHSQSVFVKHQSSVGNFVRLSDLDKAPSKLSGSDTSLDRITENITSLSLGNKTKSWRSKTTGPNCSQSLARVIPAIKDLPSSSFIGMEEGSQDDENTRKEFWQDLKHVFVNNLCTDLIVEVAGRRIGAHKIVLTHRCPYFAAALSGGWVESGGNVIRLRGFSYPAVHFALYHIYVGSLTIPENISIVELAMLCDLFHLDSLKETVELELAKKMCHSFHDPQNLKCACMSGTLETLVLAAAYSLEYLYPKCLRWSSTHFYKVCQTAPFLSLPNELKDKILKSVVNHCDKEGLTKEEALELKVFTAVNAIRLLTWAEKTDLARSSLSWFHRLRDETHKVVAKALNTLLSNTSSFHLLVRDTVDAVLLYSVQFATPEELCLVYRTLFLSRIEDTYEKYPEGAKNVLERLLDSVVTQLVGQASKVVRTRAWNSLNDPMQAPILEKAGFPRRRQEVPLQRSATSDKHLPARETISSSGFESVSASPGLMRSSGNRLQNLRQVKQVIAQHVNGTNQGTLDPVPLRRSAVPVATTVKRREVKSRYAEIKSRPLKAKSVDASVSQRHSYCAPATLTSSDSSAITPTEYLSDAATAVSATCAAATTNTIASHKRKGRPTSAPLKQVILPRRCASSTAVSSKDRVSAPPFVPTTVTARTKKTSTSSTSTSASASASTSAPTSASVSISAKKITGPASRLNIPLRTCRSSSSVPQATSSVAIRKDILKTGDMTNRKGISTQPRNQATPLKPLNGTRVQSGIVPSKRMNGLSSKPNTRTVGCGTNDLNSKPKTQAFNSVSSVSNGGSSTSKKSTSDMATDTSDITVTRHDGHSNEHSCSKDIVLASRSGTFLKDEPTVLRRSDKP